MSRFKEIQLTPEEQKQRVEWLNGVLRKTWEQAKDDPTHHSRPFFQHLFERENSDLG